MASSCNPHHFLSQRISLWLALVLTMTWAFTVTESTKRIDVQGEVGGNVTIHCPCNKQKNITFFYFQQGVKFVNGYYASKTIPPNRGWENTRVDKGSTTVHMYNLSISHIGRYKCIIQYTDKDNPDTFEDVHIKVTATYSKPEVTVASSEDKSTYLVTCTSHGGYPRTSVEWNVPRTQMWRRVNKSEMEDRDTLMFNSSSTASFNCSKGEMIFISCQVGNVTSDRTPVCKDKVPEPPVQRAEIIAAIIIIGVAVVVLAIMVASALWWKHKKRQQGAAAADVKQEWRANGREEEVVELKENDGGNKQP
ncbi:T-lymphocyte activation antigen CD80-like isoform X2 [Pagrus major]|uniref:T-lymphocyte activation antigen CD80-like isoform X2 n=1 Tax=Pagrus major TaxID=143350 RepID=UPI003CC88245